MLLPIIATVCALIAPPLQAGAAPTQATTKLERVYKVDDSDTYALEGKGGGDQSALVFSAKITFKVAKLTDSGADVLTTAKDLSVEVGGQQLPLDNGSIDKTLKFDRNGMASGIRAKDIDVLLILASVSSYVPGTSVATGAEFPIKWKATDDAMQIAGTGKLVSVDTVDGQQVATLKLDMVLTPEGDKPGDIHLISKVAVATGKVLSSEGSVEPPGEAKIQFKMSRKK
jgi:hypothetical protein